PTCGAKFEHLLPETGKVGLAPLCGSAPHVGIVGYALGGGYSLLSRQYGLAIDHVLSAQVVNAEGELIRASATENPDLFWAIRGGGGAFGVITELEMALVPVATVYGGATIYPAENVEELLNAYAAWIATLPDNVTSCLQLMNLPPAPFLPPILQGRAVVNINACVCGDLENAEELVRPMRELGEPLIDMWSEFPFAEAGRVFQDPVDPMPAIGKGVLLTDFNAETVANLAKANGPVAQSPIVSLQVRHLGGASARVAHEATPIGCRREAAYLVYALAVPNPMAPPEAIAAHQERIFEALMPHTLCNGPLNFLGEGNLKAESIRGVYNEASYRRLCEVK
ncbi:MAG: FAD-binding oxidoreductase, partial [Hyphomicrobiales bacterium]